MLHRIFTALVVLLVLACGSRQAWAAKGGPEFRVNTTTASDQLFPSVARLSDGGFVVTWTSLGEGSQRDVYGQRYSAAGAPVGGEFRINTYTASHQWGQSVAGLSDGGFVVTWQSFGQDGDGYGVYGQRYSAAGGRNGGEFLINTYKFYQQAHPSVAGLSSGGFVVTWTSYFNDGDRYGIFGQRYTALGARAGGEFRVNSLINGNQQFPFVARLSNGGFVVTWQSFGQDNSPSYSVYGQRYSASGARAGGEFRANTYTLNDQSDPSVAGLGNGGFVVTWTSVGQDGSGEGIYAQRYSAAGAPAGSEFRVNTYTADSQDSPSVASLDNGGFVVTWSSKGQDGSWYGVYGQRYSGAGARVGGEFRVNTFTADSQASPSVAGLSDSNFVVTWHSAWQDGSGYGVYGQRYGNYAPAITLDPVSQTVTSGQTVTFTADASGSPTPTVQWQFRQSGGTSFTDITGATAKNLAFITTSRQSGNQYRAVFSNSLGTATTNAATLTVTFF